MARSAAIFGLMVLLCTTVLVHGVHGRDLSEVEAVEPECTNCTPVTTTVVWTLAGIKNLLNGLLCHVGDSCLFNYNPLVDILLEVSLADYLICNTANPIHIYKSGHDLITYPSKGKHYYICGSKAHCLLGLKLTVTVA